MTVGAGGTRRVTVHLDARSFQYWDEPQQAWCTPTGQRTIWVGDADAVANLPLSTTTAPLVTGACASPTAVAVRGLKARRPGPTR